MWPSDGELNPARGTRGGYPGANALTFRRHEDGTLERLAAWGDIDLSPGQTIISVSAAGGGYGPPRARDPSRVCNDVVEGWVTPESAASVYGVVLTADETLDQTATEAARSCPASAEDEPPERIDVSREVLGLIRGSGPRPRRSVPRLPEHAKGGSRVENR
jgi:N-methylhydantoinase B